MSVLRIDLDSDHDRIHAEARAI